MNSQTILTLTAFSIFGIFSAGWAQEPIPYSYSHPSDSNEYTVQHLIEVNDVPGHVIRVASIESVGDSWLNLDPPVVFKGVQVVGIEAQLYHRLR